MLVGSSTYLSNGMTKTLGFSTWPDPSGALQPTRGHQLREHPPGQVELGAQVSHHPPSIHGKERPRLLSPEGLRSELPSPRCREQEAVLCLGKAFQQTARVEGGEDRIGIMAPGNDPAGRMKT